MALRPRKSRAFLGAYFAERSDSKMRDKKNRLLHANVMLILLAISFFLFINLFPQRFSY